MLILSGLSEALEPHSRQLLQLLVKRLDFNTQRLQRRNAKQRLRPFISEKYRTSRDFAHEFDARDGKIHPDFSTAIKLIRPLRRKRRCGIGGLLIAKFHPQSSCLIVRHYTLPYPGKTTENAVEIPIPSD